VSIFDRLKLATYNAATWQNIHYALAAAGTLVLFGTYIVTKKLDLGFAGFVTGMWTTAVGNDRINTPPTK
jgi:hypothetical protein